VYAKLHGVESTVIPLLPDMTQDKQGYLAKSSFVVIANPNAPTGEFIPLSEIEKIVEANKDGVVLIDEAYVDFGGESAIPLTEKYDNLLVVCTYSKSRSLAGARLGFAIGNEELIGDLEKIKYSTNPYNVNRLTLAMGVAAIKDEDYYKENCKRIIETREYTAKELTALGFEVLPSKANFIFAKSEEIGGMELYLALKERGILVRHFDSDRIKEYNRITIGSKDEMVQFIKTVKEIIGK
jgi:histidinol-phosphate aminotransferase